VLFRLFLMQLSVLSGVDAAIFDHWLSTTRQNLLPD
jgi:hypothetical protein